MKQGPRMGLRGVVCLWAGAAAWVPCAAQAREVAVTDAASLGAAVAAAQPGDEIVLESGTYALGNLNCSTPGTEAQPIVVRSRTPLGALLMMSGLEGFKVSAAHWHFEDLDIRGACGNDDDCEHAFHVYGAADGFVMRHNRVRDFNAQLKVNAAMVNGAMRPPHRGLVEYNDVGDTRGRNTGNPVTKLNIDTGDDWVVRGNVLHDFAKLGGNTISYGAFMKSGGSRGIFERNLVLCARDVPSGGVRIGLSFGGGGTGAQFCAPAFDAAVPCSVEHTDGILRNNIIANCNDVGIYINRGANTSVLHNTLVGTSGVDFRFDTTTGTAVGNVVTGNIRPRDSAMFTNVQNVTGVAVATFESMYQAPLLGDLRVVGDVSMLQGTVDPLPSVTDDYCVRARPSGMRTRGAVEHALGDCDTRVPLEGGSTGVDGGVPASSGSQGSSAAGSSSSGTTQTSSATSAAGSSAGPGSSGASAGVSAGSSSAAASGTSSTSGAAPGGDTGGDDNGAAACACAHARGVRPGAAVWGLLALWVGRRRRATR